MSEWSTCRFCGEMDWREKIRYAVRHSAHAACFVAALGWPEALRRLGDWDSHVYCLARIIATEALATDAVAWPVGVRFEFGTTTEARESRVRRQQRESESAR